MRLPRVIFIVVVCLATFMVLFLCVICNNCFQKLEIFSYYFLFFIMSLCFFFGGLISMLYEKNIKKEPNNDNKQNAETLGVNSKYFKTCPGKKLLYNTY